MNRKALLLVGALAVAIALRATASAEDDDRPAVENTIESAPEVSLPAPNEPAPAPDPVTEEPAKAEPPPPPPPPAAEVEKPAPPVPRPVPEKKAKPAPPPPPVEKPAPPPAPAEKPAPSCLVAGAAAETIGCVQAYKNLSDGYLEAYKAMESWLAATSSEIKGMADGIAQLEAKVQDSEAALTKLKLERSKDAKTRMKDLELANKQVWTELETARKSEAARCKGISRDAAQKVKDIAADIAQRLSAAGKMAQ